MHIQLYMYLQEWQLIVNYSFNWDSDIIYNRQFDNEHRTNIFHMNTVIIWGQKEESFRFSVKKHEIQTSI